MPTFRCIVKITGDMTISFPSGVIKVFTSNPSPAVLCFRVKNINRLEQILPNAQLVFMFWCPFFSFLATPCGMRDFSSLTRYQTSAPCNGSMES